MQAYNILAYVNGIVMCQEFKAETIRAVFEYVERRFSPWGSSVEYVSITKIEDDKEVDK